MRSSIQGQRPKILVCDDDLMVRMLARECLEEAGMTVVEAWDGDEAVTQFALEQPDLVFLDVEMPGKTGFEVCEAIRGTAAGSSVPILIATGADDKQSIDLGFNAGATQYKTKPINWSLLSRDIRYMLRAADAFNELKAKEDRLRYLAYYDHLTELPNRRSFNEQLRKALIEAEQAMTHVGLFVIDIDHFKRINDSIGHERGDQLLRSIASRLNESLSSLDKIVIAQDSGAERKVSPLELLSLARTGGDEFTLITREVPDETFLTDISQAILRGFKTPLDVDNHHLVVTPSIGIAQSPQHGEDPETLLRHADAAMHAAKSSGRATVRLYDDSLEDHAAERLRLEADLRIALESDHQLYMAYQPQISASTGKVEGVEALIRWNHPELGAVPPVKFIPVAERSGLIVALGDWILRRVNRDALEAGHCFPTNVAISINLSPLQFTQSNFIQKIASTLADLDLKYTIELELTEGVIMSDAKDSLAKLQELKSMGFDLAIDDFGTGYSSLNYLRQFPIDTLKIDRSFVIGIGSAGGEGIVRAILGLGHALGLRVVAEGIETREQAAYLTQHGCTSLQGFLFSRALSVGDLVEAVNRDYSELIAPPPAERLTSSA